MARSPVRATRLLIHHAQASAVRIALATPLAMVKVTQPQVRLILR